MNNLVFLNQAKEIIKSTKDSKYKEITIFANLSSLIYNTIEDLNWAGFYLVEDNNLVLGPFQGKVACTNIPFSKGICGRCATELHTINVANVHEDSDHIACDSASNSELVIPVFKDGVLFALLDIDSPKLNRFTPDVVILLETVVCLLNMTL